MYSIPLKDNGKAEIDMVVIRSLLALSGITAFFYGANSMAFINATIAVTLLAAAFAARYLLAGLQVKKAFILAGAALLLIAATHSIIFGLLLFGIGMLTSLIYKPSTVVLSTAKIAVKSSKGTRAYDWDDFENVVLKDSLLTLDFKNNKLLQLEMDDAGNVPEEDAINSFCQDCLLKNNLGNDTGK